MIFYSLCSHYSEGNNNSFPERSGHSHIYTNVSLLRDSSCTLTDCLTSDLEALGKQVILHLLDGALLAVEDTCC